jgi:hypothetical protein
MFGLRGLAFAASLAAGGHSALHKKQGDHLIAYALP